MFFKESKLLCHCFYDKCLGLETFHAGYTSKQHPKIAGKNFFTDRKRFLSFQTNRLFCAFLTILGPFIRNRSSFPVLNIMQTAVIKINSIKAIDDTTAIPARRPTWLSSHVISTVNKIDLLAFFGELPLQMIVAYFLTNVTNLTN